MANYSAIKSEIDVNIKANGNEEITGPVLNGVLNDMVDTLGYSSEVVDLTTFIAARFTTYISATTGKWTSSSATRTFYVPVMPGVCYRIQAKPDQQARYAVVKDTVHTVGTVPNYSDSDSGLHIIPVAKHRDVVIPSDAAYLAVNYTVSNVVVTPVISILTPYPVLLGDDIAAMKVRESGAITFETKKRIDCRSTSANFGLVVSAPDSTWGTTQLIDITGAKKIRFYGTLGHTSGNYQGWTGLCFYDESGVGIKTGVYVIQPSVQVTNGWWDLDVPAGAKYVRYTALVSTQSTSRPVKMFRLEEEDIYNPRDLSILTSRYEGQKIHLDKFAYRWMTYAGNAVGGQSAAIFGDYLFIVEDYLAKISCYNIRTRKLLYTLTTGISAPTYWHCNQSQFGPLYYDPDDDFPLLYIAMQNDPNNRGSWVAFRIVPTYTDGEISSFTLTQVQTIHLPVMTDANCMGHPNMAYDKLNNCFWAYHRNNNSAADNYRKARFSKFAVPAIWNGSTLITDVDLTDADILDTFGDDRWSMYNAQGGFILDGKLYIVQGYPGAGYVYLRVVDLYVAREMVSLVDLLRAGVSQEPEGLVYWEGDVYFTTGTQRIVRLSFD